MKTLKYCRKALFLDRDGILNYLISNRPPWKINEIKIFDEAYDLINLAKDNFFIPIVISNQPDAGRGSLTYEDLDLINKKIMAELKIDYYYICKHPYDGICNCRKPKSGSFFKAQNDHNIDLVNSYMIGDRLKDIIAGKNAGCKTILLSESKNKEADFNVANHSKLIDLLRDLFR